MKSVQIVTISKKIDIFKGEDVAERIELINLDEIGFGIISQKDLYEVGDKAIYIQPDFCLPNDNELFEGFTAPGGDPNKSRLGKENRIRALKFNFHKGDGEVIYSMGILLPYDEVSSFLGESDLNGLNLDELLNITKYEVPERGSSGQAKGDMPVGMYKTDENNFENIHKKIEYPKTIIGTLKVDGSSITCYINGEGEDGICSRTFEKKLVQSIIIGYESPNGNTLRKHFDRELKVRGWIDTVENKFYQDVPSDHTPIMGETSDSWVTLGTDNLNKLRDYYKDNGVSLAARGEIVGTGLKGSGNKNNPHAKGKQKMFTFGLDSFENGVTVKLPMKRVIEIVTELDIEFVPIIFTQTFNNEQELRGVCDKYFKNNLVEGIVLRSFNDTSLSTKFMNPEYDSRK